MKPHLSVFSAYKNIRWRAVILGHLGYGATPQDAYNALMARIKGIG